MENKNLRLGNKPAKKEWTLDEIKAGFNKFFEEYKRYPTAHDIDKFAYLPASRSIQRSWGGLKKLRKLLNLSIEDFTIGNYRSNSSKEINIRGREWEDVIYQLLVNKFGEMFVHCEKPINSTTSKRRFDFYVYCKPKNFSVDVFYPSDYKFIEKIKVVDLDEFLTEMSNFTKYEPV